MDRLFRLILSIEIIKQTPNRLVQINIQHILIKMEESRKGKKRILKEMQRNDKLRYTIYSCIINCTLPEYRFMSPFYVCCSLGKQEIFDYMKQYEANMNTADVTNTLCIHAAIRSGNEKIVQFLLAMNANCTTPNKVGETPLMCACSKKLEATALSLLDVFSLSPILASHLNKCAGESKGACNRRPAWFVIGCKEDAAQRSK